MARAFQVTISLAGWRLVAWGAALALFAAGLCFVPLFDVLGYDFAFALGLAVGFAATDIGHGAVAAARRAVRPLSLPRLIAAAVAGALAALVLPLLFSLANALRVKNCHLPVGLAFYALLPVGSALYAAPLGALAALACPGRGRLLALALPFGSIAWSLLRLYRDPATFAMDPFGGYFPGPIYDEALRPPARFVAYRLVNLLWVAAALAVASLHLRRPARFPRIAVAAGLAAAATVCYLLRGELRFHVSKDDLVAVLSRKTESPHFVLHSDPRAESASDIDLAQRDLEFRYHQLARILGVEPAGRIVVYRFPHAASKQDLVGAATTLYAKPWTREVFLQADRFPAARLRHELAHVFAGAFGDPIFGVALGLRFAGPIPVPHLASGLVEGVAEAADFGDPDGRSTLHEEARAMLADGRAPTLTSVLGTGFTTFSAARAYTVAGSFCRFLLDTYGPARLRDLYRSGGDFPRAYGRPLADLEARWRAFLDTRPIDASVRARARETFRRPAIFHKVCARELAARVADAKRRAGSAPHEAVALLESVCRDDPGEPTHRLDLADALMAAGEHERALAVAAAIERDPHTTHPLRARAANLAGTLHFHAGRVAEAEAATRRTLVYATDYGEERTALAKLRALRDPDSRRTLGRMLFGDGPARATDPAMILYLAGEFDRRFPDEALGPYLVGRHLAWRDPKLGIAALERACPDDQASAMAVPLGVAFLKECRRLLGETSFQTGDLSRSRAAFERLRADATIEADRLRAMDFLERIEWEGLKAARRSAEARAEGSL